MLKLDGPGYIREADHESIKTKLAEFRDNNRGLNSKVTEFETKLRGLEGLDPVKYNEMQAELAALKTKGVSKADDVSEVIRKALETHLTPLKAQLDEMTQREAAAQQQIAYNNLENYLVETGRRLGVQETAINDFINRGIQVFDLDGNAMNGEEPVYSKKNPAQPLTIDEWAESLTSEAPHLFRPSNGGGARPGAGSAPAGPKRTIHANDVLGFGQNLDAIAKGEMSISHE